MGVAAPDKAVLERVAALNLLDQVTQVRKAAAVRSRSRGEHILDAVAHQRALLVAVAHLVEHANEVGDVLLDRVWTIPKTAPRGIGVG